MKARGNVALMTLVCAATLLGAAQVRSTITAASVTISHPPQVHVMPLVEPPGLVVSASARTALTVEYQNGRLSVSAEKVPLARILREVAHQTGLEIQGLESVEADVSVRFSGLPLRDGLLALLAHVNYILIKERSQQGSTRPTRALVLGRAATPPPETIPDEERAKPAGEIATQEEPGGMLAALVADPHPSLRQWAVERLAEKGDEEAFIRLLETLEDENPEVRQAALAGLGQYGWASMEPLKALLHREKDTEVRAAALHLLGQVGREEMVDLLRGMLADEDPQIRIAAVEALGFAGSSIATDALIGAAADADAGVRIAALRTLALYVRDGPVRAIVEQSLSDEEEAVQAHAADLLEIFTE